MRALVVEDEKEMARILATELDAQGFSVDAVASLSAAKTALLLGRYALILLDRRLADGDGLSLLPGIRSRQADASIIVLSALGDAVERVVGLDAGADDYVGKPFHADELRARIRAVMRRPAQLGHLTPVRCGNLCYDAGSRDITVQGQPMVLRRREAALLGALMRRARRVVRRETLIEEVYGFDEEPTSNSLEAHVSRLRSKLQEMEAGVVLQPVRGVGYLIDER